MSEKLLPCPCCATGKGLFLRPYPRDPGPPYCVECDNDDCHHAIDNWWNTKAHAAAEWNRRNHSSGYIAELVLMEAEERNMSVTELIKEITQIAFQTDQGGGER